MQKATQNSFIKIIPIFSVLLPLAFLIKNPESCSLAICTALDMCALKIIPSLFLSTVTALFLSQTKIPDILSSLFGKLISWLGIPRAAVPAYLCGLFFGFPVGAVLLRSCFKKGQISENCMYWMLPLCTSPSFSFIVSGVGIGFFKNKEIGLFLYGTQLCATVILTLLMKRHMQATEEVPFQTDINQKPFSVLFCDSISDATQSMLKICGFITFFYVYAEIFTFFLSNFLPKDHMIIALVRGFFEFSCGTLSASSCNASLTVRLAECSSILAFGGISIMLQAFSLLNTKQISKVLMRFYAVKLILCLMSALICVCFLQIPAFRSFGNICLPSVNLQPSAPKTIVILLLFILGVLLCTIRKAKFSYKNNSKNKF